MKPGGLFVLDVRNRDTALKGLFPYIATENGKDSMIDPGQLHLPPFRRYKPKEWIIWGLLWGSRPTINPKNHLPLGAKRYHVFALMIDRITFDSLSGRMYNKRIVIRDGARKEKPYFMRYYNPSEMRTFLAEVDLTIREIYGGYDGTPIPSDSCRMIIVSEK